MAICVQSCSVKCTTGLYLFLYKLDLFAPIVSRKNIKELFVVYDEIVSIFDEMSIRLNM